MFGRQTNCRLSRVLLIDLFKSEKQWCLTLAEKIYNPGSEYLNEILKSNFTVFIQVFSKRMHQVSPNFTVNEIKNKMYKIHFDPYHTANNFPDGTITVFIFRPAQKWVYSISTLKICNVTVQNKRPKIQPTLNDYFVKFSLGIIFCDRRMKIVQKIPRVLTEILPSQTSRFRKWKSEK